jgi:membrane protein YdbS with pleckstrin-like domain
MFDWIRQRVLFLMRVPPDPAPPSGAPGSTRVFRAGRQYFTLRIIGWGLAQLVALAAIIFWAVMLIEVEAQVHEQKKSRGLPPALTVESFARSVTAAAGPQAATADSEPAPSRLPPTAKQPKTKTRHTIDGFAGFKQFLVVLALRLPDWAFPLIWMLKISSILLYLAQIPFTFTLRRLDYELRWYIVTDRSLRIRTGLVRLQESTMSFANLQQVEVKQDPVQRLLGLADVHVQSAGGGSGHHDSGQGQAVDSLHTGIFHSVDNATEIRDLILERLRRFRQAGLGDPDDHHDHVVGDGPAMAGALREASAADTLAAAHELLVEARALRSALS